MVIEPVVVYQSKIVQLARPHCFGLGWCASFDLPLLNLRSPVACPPARSAASFAWFRPGDHFSFALIKKVGGNLARLSFWHVQLSLVTGQWSKRSEQTDLNQINNTSTSPCLTDTCSILALAVTTNEHWLFFSCPDLLYYTQTAFSICIPLSWIPSLNPASYYPIMSF